MRMVLASAGREQAVKPDTPNPKTTLEKGIAKRVNGTRKIRFNQARRASEWTSEPFDGERLDINLS
ncbi:hypothetical protein THMIRHAS_12040 [Thiosulfatimonas sediminis]|uniref:Uncharacterized protein n=1 Tax=Thiosulfatimonas sediminis TaxID=2675054 RepID=A0A6F8PUM4_9GAMM|nr:hypothetical protein THMIRHAS_12040 [Thiosulfatimonas sediminis]